MSTNDRPPRWEQIRPYEIRSDYEELLRRVGAAARHEARVQEARQCVLAYAKHLSDSAGLETYNCLFIVEEALPHWLSSNPRRWPHWMTCGPRTPKSPSGDVWKSALWDATRRAASEYHAEPRAELGADIKWTRGNPAPVITWGNHTLHVQVPEGHSPENDPLSLAWAALYHKRRCAEIAATKAASET